MRRRTVWIVAGAVVLLAVGALLWFALSRPASPDDTAGSFLRALESGDTEQVEKTGVDMTDDALAAFAAAASHIQDARVESTTADGDTASARVRYALGGEERSAELTLSLADGRWTVDAATATASVTIRSTLGGFARIGETTFAVEEKVALLPAEYVVQAAPAALVDAETKVLALPGESVDVALEPALRPEATATAQDHLDAYLAECAKAATDADAAAPPSCGIRIPWGVEFTAVASADYRIEKTPTIELEATGFRAVGGTLVATLTGTGHDGAARTQTYRTESWSVRGDVTFTADDIQLTVW